MPGNDDKSLEEFATRETRLAVLDAAIARGVADSDAGRLTPAFEVFGRLEAKYHALAKLR
jgi:antitoxin ParD1/3/4